VNGEIIYDEKKSNIHISIPFKLNELGNRRYYRLPDIGMMGKKVLLISKNKNVAQSLQKMFKYFLYEVDVGKDAYKNRGSNLAYYDIFVLDSRLVNEGIEDLVRKVQNSTDLKYVILSDSNESNILPSDLKSKLKLMYLVKPVMQESILELIVALFTEDIDNRKIKSLDDISMISMDKYIDEAFVRSEKMFVNAEVKNIKQNSKKSKKKPNEDHIKVLDVKFGLNNAKKRGLDYHEELKSFLETFDRSDIYFRNITQDKAIWQIKEFCMELEKQARYIGAGKIADIAEQVSLVFVYDKMDDLPMYAVKYHLELESLIPEIKNYLAK
jgi:DNA-binding response OmpR family regulator